MDIYVADYGAGPDMLPIANTEALRLALAHAAELGGPGQRVTVHLPAGVFEAMGSAPVIASPYVSLVGGAEETRLSL